jgi:cytochrome c-type biogenesis protein
MGLLTEMGFAIGAGVATFLAPCAFPLIPGYVGYYLSQSETPRVGQAAVATTLGAAAMLGAIATIGTRAGTQLLRYIPQLEPLIGVLLILAGLALLGGGSAWRVGLGARPVRSRGFVLFGALYALAAAGCVAPVLLGVIAGSVELGPMRQLVVIAAYTAAMAVPLGVVTVIAAVTDASLQGLGALSAQVERLGGVVLIGAGAAQMYLSLYVWEVL